MVSKRKKITIAAVGLIALGFAGFFILTSPWLWSATHKLAPAASADGPVDLKNGRLIFVASDCATCHATTEQDNDELLGGGMILDSDFGRFHMPNISPDPKHGIGDWTLAEFDRALRQGVGPSKILPDGQNLYPSFPYTSYVRLTPEDVRDLYAYMMQLPPTDKVVPKHELKFPYNIRRGVGVWRLAFLNSKSVEEVGVKTDNLPADVDKKSFERGRYLVESAGHCVECHSPRNFIGSIPSGMRYAGGENPEGTGYFPNITPSETGVGFWSQASMVNYLHSGTSPVGLNASGDMAEVVENTSQLSWDDLQAMAVYLKHLPAVEKTAPGMPSPNYTDKVVMLKSAFDSRPPMPTSKASDIKAGSEVYVVGTKSLYADANSASGDIDDGKLLGGTATKVLAKQGDLVQLEVTGWQPEDAASVIYQERGKRIIVAALGDKGTAEAKRGATEIDPATDIAWRQVAFTAWTDTKDLHLNQDALWSYSRDAYVKSCAACHTMPQEGDYSSNEWIGTMGSMKRFISFSDDEYRLILSYLQNHSSDLNVRAGAAK